MVTTAPGAAHASQVSVPPPTPSTPYGSSGILRRAPPEPPTEMMDDHRTRYHQPLHHDVSSHAYGPIARTFVAGAGVCTSMRIDLFARRDVEDLEAFRGRREQVLAVGRRDPGPSPRRRGASARPRRTSRCRSPSRSWCRGSSRRTTSRRLRSRPPTCGRCPARGGPCRLRARRASPCPSRRSCRAPHRRRRGSDRPATSPSPARTRGGSRSSSGARCSVPSPHAGSTRARTRRCDRRGCSARAACTRGCRSSRACRAASRQHRAPGRDGCRASARPDP